MDGVWLGDWLCSNGVRWQETPLAQEEQHRNPKASIYSVVVVLRDTLSALASVISSEFDPY